MDPAVAEMKDVVQQTLETKGVLSKIRVGVQLRDLYLRNQGANESLCLYSVGRTAKKFWSLFRKLTIQKDSRV